MTDPEPDPRAEILSEIAAEDAVLLDDPRDEPAPLWPPVEDV